MRFLTFALFLTATIVASSVSTHAEDRMADYGSMPKKSKPVVEKSVTRNGNTQLHASPEDVPEHIPESRMWNTNFTWNTSQTLFPLNVSFPKVSVRLCPPVHYWTI